MMVNLKFILLFNIMECNKIEGPSLLYVQRIHITLYRYMHIQLHKPTQKIGINYNKIISTS